MDKIYYLYKITNQINGKNYIGQTIAPKQRWYDHKQASNNPKVPVQFAIKKYGVQNFMFEIIACCINQDDANWTETELVKQYDSFVANGKGYNATLGGMNAPKTEEWKAAMSAIKGGWIGKDHTEENKEIFRQYHLGSTHSEETILKQSQTMKEKVADGWMPKTTFTPGADATKYWQGKKRSEESIRKTAEANKGRIVSEETRQKISEAQIGKIIPEEQRQKMSDAKKGKHLSTKTEFKKGLVPWNKKVLSQDQINEVIKMTSEGNGTRKISKLTGINRRRISKMIKEQEKSSGS
jgi:group I intron endonuclease